MSRILLTGASGLLGLSFGLQYHDQHEIVGVVNKHLLRGAPFEVRQVDLAQPGAAEKLISEVKPEIVLHCAALANIDQAESHPGLAQRINAEIPGEIAALMRQSGGKMIHISTDLVFDGQRGDYREMEETNPINVYARTKLAGEQAVLQANPDAIVARVKFLRLEHQWEAQSGRNFLQAAFHREINVGFHRCVFLPAAGQCFGRNSDGNGFPAAAWFIPCGQQRSPDQV